RPIIMTSFAFIMGVIPLMISLGAGAEMRRTLGVAVFSGMLGVTIFGIFLTPVFYYSIQYFADRRMANGAARREVILHLEHDGVPADLAATLAEEDLDCLRDLTNRLGAAHVKQLADALQK